MRALEHLQAQGISHLCGKPIPVFDHPHSEEIFPDAQSEPSLAQLCAVPVHSVISDQEQSLEPPTGQDTGHAHQPFCQFCCPPLDTLQSLDVFLTVGGVEGECNLSHYHSPLLELSHKKMFNYLHHATINDSYLECICYGTCNSNLRSIWNVFVLLHPQKSRVSKGIAIHP